MWKCDEDGSISFNIQAETDKYGSTESRESKSGRDDDDGGKGDADGDTGTEIGTDTGAGLDAAVVWQARFKNAS